MYEIVKDKKALRTIAKPVLTKGGENVEEVMSALEETYKSIPGCQMLHAKQLGFDVEMAICKTGKDSYDILTNLSVLKNGPTYMSNEGSFSLIGRYLVKRYKTVTVSYDRLTLRENGVVDITPVRNYVVTNLNEARVYQHCRNMCDGKLLCDVGRLVSIKDPAKRGKFKEW